MAIKEKEELPTNALPKGSNTMNARSVFLQRKLYERLSFSSSLLSPSKPIDFWYKKPYYGRIDSSGRAIQVSEENLVHLREDVFVLNFVADAYNDLSDYMLWLDSRGAIERSSPYTALEPTRGWQSIDGAYHQLMEMLFVKFKAYLVSFRKDEKITDFDSFMEVFVEFIDSVTPLIPITKSSFILSKKSSPLVSGLVIDLSEALFSEDSPKVEDFLEDANFPIFKDAAQKFGFKIDKHAPWRIVADIGSPALVKYLANYDVDNTNVMERYFFQAHYSDLSSLRTYIIEFYNSYVTAKPTIVVARLKTIHGKSKVCSKEIVRVAQEEQPLATKEDTRYWLRFYSFIRAREENKGWSQVEFDIFVKRVLHYEEGRDTDTALDYISRKTSSPSGVKNKERNFHFFRTKGLTVQE